MGINGIPLEQVWTLLRLSQRKSLPLVLALKSARGDTYNSEPDVVVVVVRIVVVTISRSTIPWIVVPGTTASLPAPYLRIAHFLKRYGNLWHQITAFENLLACACRAQRGKRFRGNVLNFNFHLEEKLFLLQTELRDHSYQPGGYTTFEIIDPKPRFISAAPYPDRVVHHALCAIIVPIFDRTLIGDTYANREGYGTHRALRRFTYFARSSKYILQCDIRKYFPSIDHEILKAQVRRKIKCKDTLWLIDSIIDGSNDQEPIVEYFPGDTLLTPIERRRGLPIGNLTSQFFANLYLNEFDHFVKENLKIVKYLRYVDDFALFHNDRAVLADAWLAIEAFLDTLRLKLHPVKSQLFETQYGANFVGFRILPDRIRVRNDNLRRGRRRIKYLLKRVKEGKLDQKKLILSLQSWDAHLRHGNTWHLRQAIFSELGGEVTEQGLDVDALSTPPNQPRSS